MKKFAKRFLSILLLSALTITYLFTLTGCVIKRHKDNGVYYDLMGGDKWAISNINGYEITGDYLYIRDTIQGKEVAYLGATQFLGGILFSNSAGKKAIRIYFPWSLTGPRTLEKWESSYDDVTEYVISSSVDFLISVSEIKNLNGGGKYVVPYVTYKTMENNEFYAVGYGTINSDELRFFIPGNISYHFNYEDEPNKGYFFIDIQEETGKLIKPPYDPQRKWYKFDGWYTEPECVNEWDFDNDEVTISYDEDGNRIYEEIKLYAKWKRSLFGI